MKQNQKIIVTVGAGGCGKSTFSSEYVKENPNTIIVSRDAIRMLLYGFNESNICDYYKTDTKAREVEVSAFADTLIRKALRDGKDVIADNTHLRRSYINAYKNFGVMIEVVWFDTDEDILWKRNVSRISGKAIHVNILQKQIESYATLINLRNDIAEDIAQFNAKVDSLWNEAHKKEWDIDKRDCYIFDIDGTLAHMTGRSPHDYSRVIEDSVDVYVQHLSHIIGAGFDAEVVIVSGRDGGCRDATAAWLEKHHMKYSALYMREAGDHRKDWMVKGEIWVEIQKEFNVLGMIDDRAQVVDFARRLGYKVYQVHPGEF